MSSLRNPRTAALSFPDEYQAPQALGLQLHKTNQIQHFQVRFSHSFFESCLEHVILVSKAYHSNTFRFRFL